MKKKNSQTDALRSGGITGNRQEVLLSAKKFRALVENNDAIIALVDENLNSIYRSSASVRITGWEHEEFEKITTIGYIHPEDTDRVKMIMEEALANPGKTISIAMRVRHKDGHYLWLEGSVTNRLHDPDVQGIITNMRDVTERKEAEQKIHKARRLFYFISQVNQMIVRTRDELTLFKEACTIAVETGEFRMAWIGIIDEATQQVIPVMQAGEEMKYLSSIKIISIADVPEGRGPTGTALREGRYIICNDIENDPSMLPWKTEALSRHYLSSISLPVKKFGKVIGAFSLYADTKNFFSEEEVELLEEATGDIAFALENFAREQMRKKAEEAVIESKRRYQTLAEISPVGIFHADETGYTTYVNPCWSRISGLSGDEALGNGWLNAVHEADRELLQANWELATKFSEISRSEYRFIRPDGSTRWVIGEAIPEKDSADRIVGYVGTITDITELKKAHDEILNERNLSDSIINSLPGIFYLVSEKGKFLRWNKNFENITKYTREEISQLHPLDLFDTGEKELLVKKVTNTFRFGEDRVQAYLLTGTKEKIPYYFTGRAIEYEGKTCLLGVGIDFSERVKSQEKIKEATQQLRKLTAHLQNIREEERKRIGREIHDELGQQLTAIKMDVAWLDKKMPAEETLFKNKLKNIIELLDGSNKSIRRILSELRPGLLDDYGLLEALEWLGNQFTTNTGIPLYFTTTEKVFKASDALVTCIFRVYQEALTNITRYARATEVLSSLKIVDGIIIVSIEDNGSGFDPDSVQIQKSFGILGMKERVLSLGGNFELFSAPGKGTKIIIHLPVDISDKNLTPPR